ncbi:phosphoenolpyruvate carboxykinase (GTP) [Microlunatus soli]|uniref:Phosphoenolpyruvate carboxykinase [GTP] n=1 Tax=Microlunatus soli TaxID=630515 RepID=A0A1H1THL7_9ACTN|nr:phosphoenolpyruvate carboxykinase (GTP) [Microlunatus soli]SDS59456.1 phosphoenolpyruvate carboxykinase (GTP) [Microlunatus soli]
MTATATRTVGTTPITNSKLQSWVDEVAALTEPDAVRWCDGSEAEWNELADTLVRAGTLVRLNDRAKPNSFYARTDPEDVARVEDRTFICSASPDDAGPTNNWMDPAEMKATMTELFRGSMHGRTMYVVPFCMGSPDAAQPMYGVEITDSAYVVMSMKIMTRMGTPILDAMIDSGADFVPCLHSVGAPLEPGETDVPWPCSDTKYISHFPEERAIWSYGSGYGGNSLLGKKCYALRIASAVARDEGWLAEHMLILKLTSPEGRIYHVAAAFPSACGKTNLALINPTIPGWKAETLGDDIAWMRFGADGRLWAVNPEYGFFGVAPGTGWDTNPNAMRAMEKGNSLFTNVALTDHGDVWWEGATTTKPGHLTDWKGRSWTPGKGPDGVDPQPGQRIEPAAHPNSRFCTPIKQTPTLAPEYNSPNGVPIDAILFGGRRKDTVPLVTQSRDWAHGVFFGATLSSETTAAATGKVGVVRRDPMAMLPFIGYHVGDYLEHWLQVGRDHDQAKLPRIFYVNWFRRADDGGFLWPGFGENSRVLKWIAERIDGRADADETPIGSVPAAGSLDVSGLSVGPEDLAAASAVDPEEWRAELPLIEEWFDRIGDKLPADLRTELDNLRNRLG